MSNSFKSEIRTLIFGLSTPHESKPRPGRLQSLPGISADVEYGPPPILVSNLILLTWVPSRPLRGKDAEQKGLLANLLSITGGYPWH